MKSIAEIWAGYKLAIAMGAGMVAFSGAVLTYGNHAKSVWDLPNTNAELATSVASLATSVAALEVQIQATAKANDLSPCAEFPAYGNRMDDTPLGDHGTLTLTIRRLRAECQLVRPIHLYVVDSAGVIHDAESSFSGRNLPVGQHPVSFAVMSPDEASTGIARVFVEVTHRLPNGLERVLVSPEVSFNILESVNVE